jgi:hypothetical protein
MFHLFPDEEMTITRCPEEGLSADYGDIIVTGVSDKLDFTVNYASVDILTETYYPDNAGAVYIRDIALLADMYRPENALSAETTSDAGAVAFSLQFKNGSQTVTRNIKLYACETETAGTLTPSVMKIIPLTRCFNKMVCPGQKEYLSFYGSGTVTLSVAYRGTVNDLSQNITFATLSENADTIYRLDVSPETVAQRAGIEPDRIISYILYKNQRYPVRFIVNRYRQPQKTFIFRNTFGAQETFTCTGDGESERKWTREYGQINRRRHLVSREMTLKQTVNTGYLTWEQTEILEDLLNSKQIALIDEYGWHPVSIEEETFKVKSRPDEMIDVEFKYRSASETQTQYRFNPKKYRIFDYTFDQTYN